MNTRVVIASVQVGNYCGMGKEYVDRLYKCAKKHLPQEHKFVCISDMEGYEQGVEVHKHNPSLKGWWQKLELFRPGRFDADLVIFFDLDTLLIGDLSPLARYSDDFAMLVQMFHLAKVKPRHGSGVMLWKPDSRQSRVIWDEYRRVGSEPKHVHGDQGFIENAVEKAKLPIDLIQRLIPEAGVLSYKVQCKFGKPDGAKVVCFHGKPKQHDFEDGHWVTKGWLA